MRKFIIVPGLFVSFTLFSFQNTEQSEKAALVESIFKLDFEKALVSAKLLDGEDDDPLYTFLVQFIRNAGQFPEIDAGINRRVDEHFGENETMVFNLLKAAYLVYNTPANQDAFPFLLTLMAQARQNQDESWEKISYFLLLELYGMEIVQSSVDYLKYIEQFGEKAASVYEKAWYHIHMLAYITKAVELVNGEELWFSAYSQFEKHCENNGVNEKIMTYYHFNKGILKRFLNDRKEAENAYKMVIELSADYPFLEYMKFSSYLHLCHIESLQGKYEEAKEHLDQAQYYFNQSDTSRSQYIFNRYSAIYYYQQVGDYQTAFDLLFKSSNDERKLDFRRNTLRISELNVQLQTAEKEKELLKQQGRLEEQEKWLWTITIFSGLLILSIIGLYWTFKKIKSKNRKIEILMRELHHRVKNNLQVISSLLGLQSMKLEDTAAKKAVTEGKERIRAMSLIHQRLYQNEEVTSLDIQDYVKSLVEELVQSYGFTDSIRLDIDVPATTLNAETSLPIGLIINELVSNSLKHAFHTVDEPIIVVILEQLKEQSYVLTISDNGPGLPGNFELEKSDSFGMRLIGLLVKQLGGSLDINYEHGLTFTINFNVIK